MQPVGDGLPEYQLVEYPDATHAFDWAEAPPTYFGYSLRYDPVATADAYARVRRFLAKYLE
jgi:dienelactone hydrolase